MTNWDLTTETKNYGEIIRLIRKRKGIKQEVLAQRVNMSQQTVSRYESMEIIDDDILEKFAKALDIPVDFFKSFNLDNTMNYYNVTNNTDYTMSTGENASGNELNQLKNQTIENQENIYNPLDTVKELYERLLQEKDKQIEELKTRIK